MQMLKGYKWVLLFLFCLLSCGNKTNTPGVYDYEGNMNRRDLAIMDAILKEYAPEATVYTLNNQPLSYGIIGLANKVGNHAYIIQFSTIKKSVTHVMFHEIGHIIDSETGRLDFNNGMTWDRVPCNFKQPWEERPWEISANEWRDCLLYEYHNKELKYYNYRQEEIEEALKCLTW